MTAEASEEMRARGMRDVLPDEMDRVRKVESAFAASCRAWGYREIRTPVIEPLHLFTAAGTLSPKMLDTVYSFLDWDGWSGERVVLRPDSTIPAARLYGERFGGIAKLFYRQNIFRFTDDGSPREEWQCGVELIGDTGPAGDVELVLLALETLAPLGLDRITVRISHAGIARTVLAETGMPADEQSRAYDRLLDGDLTVVDEIEARLPQLNAPLRLLFEVEGAGSAYVANVRNAIGPALPALIPSFDDLAVVTGVLEASGFAPIVQAVLARSFEYYSGTVFKIFAGDARICSGGRYDHLAGLIGERPAPASGFAHYVSPIVERMHDSGASGSSPRVLVEPAAGAAGIAAAHAAARALRAAGVVAATSLANEDGNAVRLRVAGDGQAFVLTDVDGAHEFASLADVISTVERGR